jgi:hypothetical protein
MNSKEEPMKRRGLLVLASFLMTCALAAPAAANVAPYVRLDYGGNELRMADGNNHIREAEASLRAAGHPASFKTIGTGYGPSASLGLWIAPWVRTGATYSYLRAVRQNKFRVDQVLYSDDLDFRMHEIGVEAAVRSVKLAGLTVGANVAWGRAELIERLDVGYGFSQYLCDARANRTRTTCGAFVGLDQTDHRGVAGFIRAGFQFRDMGRMPSRLTEYDGTNIVRSAGDTTWLDYSGFYLKFGVGYDLVR